MVLGTIRHPSVAGDDFMQIGQWRLAADGATFSVSHIDGQAQLVETKVFSRRESSAWGFGWASFPVAGKGAN